MSTTESPLHVVSIVVIGNVRTLKWKPQAHQHAANAEDFLNEGLLIPAAEEHAKAAKAFLQCEEKSNDSNVLLPLRYRMPVCLSALSFCSQTKRTLRMLYNEHIKAERDLERRIAKLREENKDPTLPQRMSLAQTHAERSSSASSGGRHTSYLAPSPPLPSSASLRLMDSQNNVDESFMVLGQRVRNSLLNVFFLVS